jgi:hypothetical protein
MNGPLDLHPKTTAASLSGALGVLTVWILGLAHVTVDPVVAAAIPTVLAGCGAWLAPVLKTETPPTAAK